jgi:hypothetical protein
VLQKDLHDLFGAIFTALVRRQTKCRCRKCCICVASRGPAAMLAFKVSIHCGAQIEPSLFGNEGIEI